MNQAALPNSPPERTLAPEPIFDLYAKALIEFIEATPIFTSWPACRQALIELIAYDEDWQLALPMLACLASGGNLEAALPVAGAWNALRHASHLLDAVQDRDSLPAVLHGRPAQALSCAAGLIFAGFRLARSPTCDPETSQRIMTLLTEAGFDSARGQYLDFERGARHEPGFEPLEDYWKSLILKSGSIYRAGAAAGAAAATDQEHQIEALGRFGTALGVMRQLLDDCRDVVSNLQENELEVTLPLLLHTLAEPDGAHTESIAGNDVMAELQQGQVPAVIADVLLEWQRRALDSLRSLERSDAVSALEQIPALILNDPNFRA